MLETNGGDKIRSFEADPPEKPPGGLQSLWNKEMAREGYPPANFSFYFNMHGGHGRLERVRGQFAESDVVFIELSGWRKEDLEDFRKLALGELSAEEFVWMHFAPNPGQTKADIARNEQKQYTEDMARLLFASNKAINFTDIPANHYLEKSLTQADKVVFELLTHKFTSRTSQPFTQTLAEAKQAIKQLSDSQAQRDSYITGQTIPKLKQTIKDYPRLKQKPKINILSIYGSAHTKLYHNLVRGGLNAERNFDKGMPLIYELNERIHRLSSLGKDIDDLFVARCWLEAHIILDGEKTLKSRLGTQNLQITSGINYSICDLFSQKEIEDLYNLFNKEGESVFLDKLIFFLKAKNLTKVKQA